MVFPIAAVAAAGAAAKRKEQADKAKADAANSLQVALQAPPATQAPQASADLSAFESTDLFSSKAGGGSGGGGGFDLSKTVEGLLQGGSIFTPEQINDRATIERSFIDKVGQRQNVVAAFGMLDFLDSFTDGGVSKKDKKNILKQFSGKPEKEKPEKEEEPAGNFQDLPDSLQLLITQIPALKQAFDDGEFGEAFSGISDLAINKKDKQSSGRK